MFGKIIAFERQESTSEQVVLISRLGKSAANCWRIRLANERPACSLEDGVFYLTRYGL